MGQASHGIPSVYGDGQDGLVLYKMQGQGMVGEGDKATLRGGERMPNGDHDYSCPGLVEQAQNYVERVKRLNLENAELRETNKKLLKQIENLKEAIRALKE